MCNHWLIGLYRNWLKIERERVCAAKKKEITFMDFWILTENSSWNVQVGTVFCARHTTLIIYLFVCTVKSRLSGTLIFSEKLALKFRIFQRL